MPVEQQDSAPAGLALSIGVAVVAFLLVMLQRTDRLHRETDLTPEDARYFGWQDTRRWLGAAVMVLLAVGIAIGSRVSPKVAGAANPMFLRTWLGVFVLIFLLLLLALLDWVATRLYARRQRQSLVREGIEILRDEARRRSYQANGHAGPRSSGDEDPSD